MLIGYQHEFGPERGLVRAIDASEAGDLARAGSAVEPLGVADFTDLQGRVDEDLEEWEGRVGGVLAVQDACIVTISAQRDDGDCARISGRPGEPANFKGSGTTCVTATCGGLTAEQYCRGTTCNSVPSGTCTGQVADSNSVFVASCGAGNAFASCCYADFNHDGTQSIDDLFLYFRAYFGTCS